MDVPFHYSMGWKQVKRNKNASWICNHKNYFHGSHLTIRNFLVLACWLNSCSFSSSCSTYLTSLLNMRTSSLICVKCSNKFWHRELPKCEIHMVGLVAGYFLHCMGAFSQHWFHHCNLKWMCARFPITFFELWKSFEIRIAKEPKYSVLHLHSCCMVRVLAF